MEKKLQIILRSLASHLAEVPRKAADHSVKPDEILIPEHGYGIYR